jgi:rsbT antagonist protein RsbS
MKEASRIPIIRLKGNLIISIQVAMSDHMVQLLKDDVTRKIEQERPAGIVIDVSGISIMDSYISRAIRDLCIMASLMGVRTALSGIDPMIALTLVEMGIGLEGVRTERDLESALELLSGETPDDGSSLLDGFVTADDEGEPVELYEEFLKK